MKVECPICKWKGESFNSFGNPKRENCKCPNCGAKERHRYIYLYFKSVLPKKKKIKVLHIAPEKSISALFRSYTNIAYLSIDINPEKNNAMQKEDITNMSFTENSFDLIYCSHVLEHVKDEKKALNEIYRVLKENGIAILQVPVFPYKETVEDKGFNNEEKIRILGQIDHVRAYGQDYSSRLNTAGFKVRENNFIEKINLEDIQKYKVIHITEGTPLNEASQEVIFECRKKRI